MSKVVIAGMIIGILACQATTHAAGTTTSETKLVDIYANSVGHPIQLNSWHKYQLANNLSQTVTYAVLIQVCPNDWPQRCVSKTIYKNIAPGQIFIEEARLTTSVTYYSVGQKAIIAETIINGIVNTKSEAQEFVTINN